MPSRSGTGFTNLSKYLQANQGNPLSSKVASGIAGTTSKTQQDVEQAGQQFQQDVASKSYGNQAQQQERADLINKAKSSTASLPGISDKDAQRYQEFSGAQYKGPEDLGARGTQLLGEAQAARQLGSAVGTEQGRKDLLQRFVGSNTYTGGQKKLDELLLGKGPQAPLKEAQKQSLGVQQNTVKQLALNKALADQARARTAAFAQETQQKIQNPLSGMENSINLRTAAAQTKSQQDFDKINQALKSGALNPSQALQLLGKNTGSVQTYGVDPTQFLTQAQAPNKYAVTSQQEQAQYDALSRLAGAQNSFIPNSQQVGTYDYSKPSYAFDKGGFEQAISQQQTAYNEALNKPENLVWTPGTMREDSVLPGQAFNLEKTVDRLKKQVAEHYHPKFGGDNDYKPLLMQLQEAQAKLAGLQDQFGYNKKLSIV